LFFNIYIQLNPISKYYKEISSLSEQLKVKNIYVFGSVLTPHFNQDSDVDFLINFHEDLTIEEYTDNYFILHEKLSLLLNRKIDLVTQRTLKNPYLIEKINSSKELIYAN
jgi:predicted nucleotidyltransferase